MAAPDFYTTLGVSHRATADEIKSAHRELVKKYHPDLFSSVTQKARANKKLQQINEAYAVLSNVERRRQYDARYFQRETVSKAPADGAERGFNATFRRPPANPRRDPITRQAAEIREQIAKTLRDRASTVQQYYKGLAQKVRTAKRAAGKQSTSSPVGSHGVGRVWNLVRPWTRWVSIKMTAVILGIMVLVLILRAMWEQPEIAVEWTLLQSTVVDLPGDAPGPTSNARNWSALSYHHSRAQCVESLRQRVAIDEQGGSKVFLDERTGTRAMTIYGKTEAALAEEFLREKLERGNAEDIDRRLLEQQAREEAREAIRKNGFSQRVKNYQCRETQVLKPESWLRIKLRQIGLFS
ncbi:MAG TPA: J domain-containing protein [Candidatus Binatia bacterium]|jgi:hypothetical protein